MKSIKRQNCQTELSESTRTAIIKALRDGESAITIAKDPRIARSTVYRIKDRFQEHGDMSSRTKPGRPHKLTDYAERYVGRMARKGDRPNWAVAATIDGGISKSALMRVVRRQEAQKKTQVKDAKESSKKANTMEKDANTSN